MKSSDGRVCSGERLENITRHQSLFVQENMNESGARRNDANTPIAYCIYQIEIHALETTYA